MQKMDAQHRWMRKQPAAKQGGGKTLVSPQHARIAQLASKAQNSPRVQKLAALAAMMNASPAMALQRKLPDMLDKSPREMKQKAVFSTSNNGHQPAAQRRQFHNPLSPPHGEQKQARPVQPQHAAASPAQLEKQPAAKPNMTGLPDHLKAGVEALSGLSMDNVRVHYNSSQPARLNALAYAQGNDIHLAPGQAQHLPHEAWHVAQQAQGRVKPTRQLKGGVPLNDDAGLEREADVMGANALARGRHAAGLAQRGEHNVEGIADQRPDAALQRQVQAWGDGKQRIGQSPARQREVEARMVGEGQKSGPDPALFLSLSDAMSLGVMQEKSLRSDHARKKRSSVQKFRAVIQREILIGKKGDEKQYKHDDAEFIEIITKDVESFMKQWLTNDFIKKNKKVKTENAIASIRNKYFNDKHEDGLSFADNVESRLEYYDGRTFINTQDLGRQVTQDLKLKWLGLEDVMGVEHHDGQFSTKEDDEAKGRIGKSKNLRIYRTMPASDWNEYDRPEDKDLKGLVSKGHGGSLGQALSYFLSSKKDQKNKDDVLVEFAFSSSANDLVSYKDVAEGGGEGGGPKNGKFTGKSEKRDEMALDQDIISINLAKHKDFIVDKNPVVKLIAKSKK
jgi:hypothetical protein